MKTAPFDVVVVLFPYSDRLAEKRRPALVVSTAELATQLDRAWLLMITSDRGERQLGDAEIGDLASAGLPAASIVRASKIATIEIDRIVRQAGRLAAADEARVRAALRHCAAF